MWGRGEGAPGSIRSRNASQDSDAFTEHGGSLQWGQPRAGRAVTGKALGTAEAKA